MWSGKYYFCLQELAYHTGHLKAFYIALFNHHNDKTSYGISFVTLEHYRQTWDDLFFLFWWAWGEAQKSATKQVDYTNSLNRGFMALLCVLNYVLNKSGLVCRWYTVGVIVKETNIVTLLVFMRLYSLAAFLFWNLKLGRDSCTQG